MFGSLKSAADWLSSGRFRGFISFPWLAHRVDRFELLPEEGDEAMFVEPTTKYD